MSQSQQANTDGEDFVERLQQDCQSNDFTIVKQLLQSQEDKNSKNNTTTVRRAVATSFHNVRFAGSKRCVFTPLHYAAKHGNLEVAEMLLTEGGADKGFRGCVGDEEQECILLTPYDVARLTHVTHPALHHLLQPHSVGYDPYPLRGRKDMLGRFSELPLTWLTVSQLLRRELCKLHSATNGNGGNQDDDCESGLQRMVSPLVDLHQRRQHEERQRELEAEQSAMNNAEKSEHRGGSDDNTTSDNTELPACAAKRRQHDASPTREQLAQMHSLILSGLLRYFANTSVPTNHKLDDQEDDAATSVLAMDVDTAPGALVVKAGSLSTGDERNLSNGCEDLLHALRSLLRRGLDHVLAEISTINPGNLKNFLRRRGSAHVASCERVWLHDVLEQRLVRGFAESLSARLPMRASTLSDLLVDTHDELFAGSDPLALKAEDVDAWIAAKIALSDVFFSDVGRGVATQAPRQASSSSCASSSASATSLVDVAVDTVCKCAMEHIARKRPAATTSPSSSDASSSASFWVTQDAKGMLRARFIAMQQQQWWLADTAQRQRDTARDAASADDKSSNSNSGGDSLFWISFGDWGYDAPHPHLDALSDAIAAYVVNKKHQNGKALDFIVLLGDNFYTRGVRDINDPRFERQWRDVFLKHKALRVPYKVVLGNHDCQGDRDAQVKFTSIANKKRNFGGLWQMCGDDGVPARTYTFHRGSVENPGGYDANNLENVAKAIEEGKNKKPLASFHVLDTCACQWSVERHVPTIHEEFEEQRAKLIDEFASGVKPLWRFTLAHHPLYTKGLGHGAEARCLRGDTYVDDGGTQRKGKGLEKVLLNGSVDACFSGHEHVMQYHERYGMRHFVCGASVESHYWRGEDKAAQMNWVAPKHFRGFAACEISPSDDGLYSIFTVEFVSCNPKDSGRVEKVFASYKEVK